MRKTRIRRASKKRTEELKVYSKKREIFLKAHPRCEGLVWWTGNLTPPLLRCANQSQDVHHTRGRTGRNLINSRTWKALCRGCHIWVHDHPREARKLKLLK